MKRQLKQLRILMLEDVVTDAELIERELQRAKIWYTARRVDSRPDFEDALERFQPDLILADYNLPSFDGVTALRLAHNRLPDVPFLFISGSIGEERAVEALRHGATDYIIKDRPQRLAPAVLRAMEEVIARAERREADAALRMSEERFRIVASATADGIWDLDLKSDQAWLSQAFRKLFDYSDAPDFVARQWIWDRIHPQDATRLRSELDHAMDRGVEETELNYRFRRGNGQYAYVLDRARIVYEGRRAIRIVAAITDTTDRLRSDRLQDAQFTIARLLTDADDIDEAMPAAAKVWCQAVGASFGIVWLTDPGTERLHFHSAWAQEDLHWLPLETSIRGIDYGRGQGLAGNVWTQGAAISGFPEDQDRALKILGMRLNLRHGYAFPITVGRQVLGGLGCFDNAPLDITSLSETAAQDIGTRIGQFVVRKRAEKALRHRVAMEEAIATISSNFINLRTEQLGAGIQTALEQLGHLAKLDRVWVVLVPKNQVDVRNANEWTAPGVPPSLQHRDQMLLSDFPWPVTILGRGETVTINSISDLPPEAESERRFFEIASVKSCIAEPLLHSGTMVGVFGFDAVNRERRWSSEDIALIRIVGQIFSNALGRKQFEETLSRSASMLSMSQRQAHLGSWELDLATGRLTCSDELYRIFGVEPGEFTATREGILERVHPEDRDRIRLSMSSDAKTIGYEFRIIRPDGTVRTLQGTRSTVIDAHGEGFRVIGSALDITEMRQASETIQRLSRQNRLILESAAEGIFGIDPDGAVTFVNPAAARILGWQSDELIGKSFHDAAQYARSDGSPYPWPETPTYISINVGSSETREEVFWRKNGTSVQVEYTSTPITDERGHRLGAVVTFRDVEERRLLEKQLEQANRLTSLGRLAATIAHEFNNVLMGIQPFTELIRKISSGDPKIQKATEQISRSVQRGKGISQEILRYTRPATPNMQQIDLQEWLTDFETEMRGVMGEKIEMKVKLPPAKLSLLGDPLQLLQVFSNLVLNARDAMPKGGRINITVTGPSSKSIYSFGVVPTPDRFVHLAVSDTGPGMTTETLSRIFEPLFTTKKSGTGLGLAVAHQIVHQHGGHIFAESEMGRGTNFHVFLPSGTAIAESDPQPTNAHEKEHNETGN
jgi:PAS domain S-box-containing protein